MPRKPTSNGAPAADTIVGVTPKVWQVLQRLAAARQTSKNRERDLCQKRKELDEELNQLGPGHTAKHLDTRSDLVITLRAIDWHRARIRSLSDKIDAILLEPNQDDLFDHLPDLESNDPDEATLFSPDGDGHGPVGEVEAPGSVMERTDDVREELEKLVPCRLTDQNGARYEFNGIGALRVFLGDQTPAGATVKVISSKQYGTRIDVLQGKSVVWSFAHEALEPGAGDAEGGGGKPKRRKRASGE